jgi:hypothetical protein
MPHFQFDERKSQPNRRKYGFEKRFQFCGLIAASILLIVVAVAIRVRAAQNDLWLDEIWSLDLVDKISSPREVFSHIHSDNNHYLNSLWLYICGFQGNWCGYRMLSILAGIGTVALAWLIGHRRDMINAIMAMLLTGFSYVLILYSSEARGYSTLIFFSVLSYYLLDCYLRDRRWQVALLFSLSACFGLISHLEFAIFFFSSFLWASYRLIKSGSGFGQAIEPLAVCYAIPTLLLALLYRIDIRYMVIAGGDQPGLFKCYATALAWALGMPPLIPTWATFGIATLILMVCLHQLWREKSDSIVFFGSVVVVMPILLAIAQGSEVLYVRYFIVSIAFFLLLMSFLLASLYTAWGSKGTMLCGFLLIGYVIANGWHLMALFRFGRGNNGQAIRYLVQNSKEPRFTVGGDQDFRIGTVVDFYNRTEIGNHSLKYVTMNNWPANGVEWLICQKESYADPAPPAQVLTDRKGHQYELAKIFPTTPLSGLHWFVYHNRAN